VPLFSGKTTMMKLLVGETTPSEGVGEVWVHHNLRLAYIAQHSMHHLEASLENTPLEYIQNRFYKGLDKELSKLTTMALTDDEKELMGQRGSIVKVSSEAASDRSPSACGGPSWQP
jgi:elongation factor 3